MVLSNAERQKRYRIKLRAAARGDALADQVGELMRSVIEIAVRHGGLWDANNEPFDADGLLAFMRDPKMRKLNGPIVVQLGELLDGLLSGDDLSDVDRVTAQRARSVIDAVNLA